MINMSETTAIHNLISYSGVICYDRYTCIIGKHSIDILFINMKASIYLHVQSTYTSVSSQICFIAVMLFTIILQGLAICIATILRLYLTWIGFYTS